MSLELESNFKGHASLQGPEQLHCDPSNPGRRLSSPEEYLGWHIKIMISKGLEPWCSLKKTIARVNHGRWICDCVWCHGGILTRPDWGVAYCAECGARYSGAFVEFPPDLKKIEAALLVRIRLDQQNWDQRQTPEELIAENERPEVITAKDIKRENVLELEESKPGGGGK